MEAITDINRQAVIHAYGTIGGRLCSNYSLDDVFVVIAYPHIQEKSTKCPIHLYMLLDIYQHLYDIHTSNSPHAYHADIRFNNMVLAEKPAKSRLIDFDFCAFSRYPHTYNTAISDGKRHGKASPGAPILKQHDLFALYYIFDKCKPMEISTSDEQLWESFLEEMFTQSLTPNVDYDVLNRYIAELSQKDIKFHDPDFGSSPKLPSITESPAESEVILTQTPTILAVTTSATTQALEQQQVSASSSFTAPVLQTSVETSAPSGKPKQKRGASQKSKT